MSTRLQKILAERGVASRRGAAEMIRSGRVTVDGGVVREPGLRIDENAAAVRVDGREIAGREQERTMALYKPRGYVCTRARGEGKSIYELIPEVAELLRPAGRLDKDSEGLVILTNDGDLIQRLTHPRFEHEKEYRVTVDGDVDREVLAALNRPMTIDGYRIQPAQVTVLSGPTGHSERTRLTFVLREGRNRQVRKMCTKCGLRVRRLVRVRVGDIVVTGLRPGEWRAVEGRR